MKNVAVREHCHAGDNKPPVLAGQPRDEANCAPGENQDRKRDRNTLGPVRANFYQERFEKKIEQDVIGLRSEPKAGHFSLANLCGKPRIVNVAGKVGGLNAGLPETGNQNNYGECRNEKQFWPRIKRGTLRGFWFG